MKVYYSTLSSSQDPPPLPFEVIAMKTHNNFQPYWKAPSLVQIARTGYKIRTFSAQRIPDWSYRRTPLLSPMYKLYCSEISQIAIRLSELA